MVSQKPISKRAGNVKITPAANDSPADAAVCTILFSNIFEFLKSLRIPIDIIAAGIDAEIVIPAYRPKYTIADERIIDRKILKKKALRVISFFIMLT